MTYMTQANWYIDPQNSTGVASDTNDGTTILTPIKSFLELENRWSNTHIVQNTNVFVLSDGYSTDPINVKASIDNSSIVAFYGGLNNSVGSGATSLQTGTFSSVSNLNRSSNTPTQATDSLGRSWSSFLGKRVRDIVTNAYAWVLKDLGSGAVRVSSPSLNGSTFYLAPVTTSSFNITNTYQVEDLRKLWFGDVLISVGNGGSGTIAFQDFELETNVQMISNGIATFVGCKFKSFITAFGISKCNLSNCEFDNSCNVYGGIVQIDAGSSRGGSVITQDGSTIIDGDYTSQGSGILLSGGSVTVGNVAVFDVLSGIAPNVRGSGIVVGGTGNTVRPNGAVLRIQNNGHGSPTVYGSGNVGYGLDIYPAHKANITSGTCVITGSSGDFILGSDATNTVYITKATASSPPEFSSSLSSTWNNFVTAQPTGFGGNAHNVSEDSHLVTN